jgi:DNA ligase-4
LRSKWKKYDTRVPPSLFGQWVPNLGDKPDLFIENPSDSIILEVKAAEIVSSDNFPCKVTLRFPRVVKCRFDKKWDDCLKYNELLDYYNISTNTIKNNNLIYQKEDNDLQHLHIIKKWKKKNILSSIDNSLNDNFETEINKEKKIKKIDKFSRMMDNFRDTDTTNIVKVSDLFKGFQFFISNLDKIAKNNLEKKRLLEYEIVANGGDKTQNYLNSTTHVIAEEIDLKIKNILNKHDINIYNSKWVYDCIKYEKIIPLSPMYLTYINEETREIFKMNIDIYNDSFFDNVDIDSLREIFNGMKNINFEKEFGKINQKIKNEYMSKIEEIIK